VVTAVRGTALIALDWGTTSARAYRMGHDGAVLEVRESALGIQRIQNAAFAAALQSLLGEWGDLSAPRIACGMIGSRQGWVEAPYVDCPAGIEALAGTLTSTPDNALAIVAGVRCRDADGMPDVMRGEETQIVGALAGEEERTTLAVLPGTHSKWAIVRSGRVACFATYMTGEIFAVLKTHSILGRMIPATPAGSDDDFLRGVASGTRAGAGSLLHRLFGVRTLPLAGELAAESISDYLSGLLIGDEIGAGVAWARGHGVASDRITLIGADALCRRYAVALAGSGIAAGTAPADAAARGLWAIAQASGWMR
jgi:2-dehydro-3-deoxygalactonokinase